MLVINEEEAKIVKYIFEEYGINHTPMIEIARKLYKMGIKTKKGNCFENRTICYILFYIKLHSRTLWLSCIYQFRIM